MTETTAKTQQVALAIAPDSSATEKSDTALNLRPRFLIVGNDTRVAPALEQVFDKPFELVRTADAEEALRALSAEGADVVLLDRAQISSPQPSGPEQGQAAPETALWMAVDLKAVSVLGDLLKTLAKASPAAASPAPDDGSKSAASPGRRGRRERATKPGR